MDSRSAWIVAAACAAMSCTKKDSTEATASAAASSTSAAKGAAAGPKCPDAKAILHEKPPFCVVPPAGFVLGKDEPFDRETTAKLTKDRSEIFLEFSRDTGDAKYYDSQKEIRLKEIKEDKSKSVIEEGKTPSDAGFFIIYKNNTGGDRWITAMAKSNKRLYWCKVQDYTEREKHDDMIEACKTLTPLDEGPDR